MYMHNRFLRVMAILLCLALIPLTTCGKDSPTRSQAPEPTPSPTPPAPVATRVEISPSSATLTSVGQAVQLTARVFDQNNAQMSSAVVTWSSSAVGVATVSSQGLVTAVMNGTAQITARSGSASANILVTVMQSVGSVVTEPSSATLMSLGETVQLTATVLDQNGQPVADAAVSWSSSDTGIASVSGQGLVTAVGNGSVTITARSGGASASIPVTVMQSVGSVAIEPSTATLMSLGETVQLTATVLDQNRQPVADAVVSWSSSDEAVATVSNQGLVTAVGNGDITITATAGDVSASVPVSVVYTGRDREALVALYNATDGPNWTNKTNWLSERPLEEWFGVTTNGAGRVSILKLGENALSGLIPSALGDLDNLHELNLWRNELAGTIPSAMGRLVNLQTLDLSSNTLRGTIPVELGDLDNLVILNLRYNELSGSIPVELGNLVNLQSLLLAYNGLSGSIPVELGKLTNLASLNLQGNRFSGPIPVELGSLVNLQSLVLAYNSLSGSIPVELGNLNKLVQLWLNNNQLSGSIPVELGNLDKLVQLWLNNNQLSGSIPVELANLSSLQQLDLQVNRLSGSIPGELGNLNNLQELELWRNELSGPIPSTLGGLENLQDLSLSVNNLTGSIPSTLGNLNNMKQLWLNNNKLSGPIPSTMGNLENLQDLHLEGNHELIGPLPSTLTKLKLGNLYMDSTDLCVPSTMAFQDWLGGIATKEGTAYCGSDALIALYNATEGAKWTNDANWLSHEPLYKWHGVSVSTEGRMRILDLADNNMQGTLPTVIGSLEHLERLVLSFNEGLSGPLPRTITGLLNLESLRLEGTQLCVPPDHELQDWLLGIPDLSVAGCGEAPQDYYALAALYQNTNGSNWTIRTNWLSEEPLGSWHGVTTNDRGRVTGVHLLDNNLVGSIPPEFGQLDKLTTLSFNRNQLSGTIPSELGQLSYLQSLDLGFNGLLRGTIPSELGQLYNLTFLNLAGNRLSGSIPSGFGQLNNLTILAVNSNGLSGTILPEFGQLHYLTVLRLGGNRLTGIIPAELGQLENLLRLDLHSNQLSGTIPSDLGQLRSLVELDLHSNQLSGAVPPELGQLHSLTHMFLNDNLLTGNMPPALGGLAMLKVLNLEENVGMTGTLPSELTSLNLDVLLLGGTQLCAPLEAGFQDWLQAIPNHRLDDCRRSYSGLTAYLTQATQSLMSNPVPLVAGEDALLRVFVTSEREVYAAIPSVRAIFYIDGTVTHTVDMTSPGISIPIRLDEGDFTSSVNEPIPGTVIEPGLEMVIEINTAGLPDPVSGIPSRLPPNGRMPIDVVDVPPFDLTLVPFLWTESPDRSVLTDTENLTAGSDLFRLTRDILPIREFFLDVREPVWTSVDPIYANRDWIIRETDMIRTMDGAGGHYMGIFRAGAGIAYQSGFVSVAVLHGATIAHELGHNMSLGHAPCGTSGGLDRRYPYPDGSIGAWGYDILNSVLVSPDTPDLMSYCGPPEWISDYHFKKALRFRVSQEQQAGLTAANASSARNLLIWGGVGEDGELILEPAFAVDAPASPPSLDGPYRLIGEDRAGSGLFNLRFGMAEIDHSESGSFAFVLPVRPDWHGRLARVMLSGPEGVVTLGDGDDRSTTLLLDDTTNMVRGILRDWPEPGTTLQSARRILPETGLEVVISRGLPASGDW